MKHFRAIHVRVPLLAAAGIILLGACERAGDMPRTDSAAPAPSTATLPEPAAGSSGWDARAGSLLLLPGATATDAVVIDPETRGVITSAQLLDSAALAGRHVVLLDASGRRIAARIGAPATRPDDEECHVPWPLVRLEADTLIGHWQAGFVGGDAQAIATDSLPGMASADSSAVVAAAARLASALPVAEEAYFRGLPFAVRSVQRFAPKPGVQALAVALVRRVNQEDSPLEERTFMIAEREGDGPWRVAYQERSTGTEDEVESAESIAPISLGPDRTLLLAVHELSDGLSYRLLERTGAARWHVMWTSAVGKCAA
jgi:hypothetical protein